MPGLTPDTAASQRMLVDDESDLVFHIPCSRATEQGDPHSPADIEGACCFTKDEDESLEGSVRARPYFFLLFLKLPLAEDVAEEENEALI